MIRETEGQPVIPGSLIHHLQAGGFPLPEDAEAFLASLPGPTRIHIPGRDSSACRVLVTLLHGNEPSGFKALHRLLQENFQPAVDIYCYLVAIEAALLAPLFTHRQVPGKRDYNRCFHPPYELDDQGPVCRQLLAELFALAPEAVVDMHNTSGQGPSFGVTTSYDEKHDEIVSLFTDRLVVTDLRLGALMEANTGELPVVTIECGGAFEVVADRIAYQGMRRYFETRVLFQGQSRDFGIELFFKPLRIELHRAATLACATQAIDGIDLTLLPDIERYNFGLVTPDTRLGWVLPDAMDKLGAFDAERQNHFKSLYREQGGGLYPRMNQKMFMITANLDIARSDCLWYVSLAD